jgi:cation diffusion facilitator CzcD-associated flavoprotein CzcO
VRADVLVVVAGPAGLAVAACLARAGIDAVVVDRGRSVGDSWRDRYDRLHLHTPRIQSALPGLRMPSRFGRWVSKDDMADYLRAYARHHGIAPVFGTEVRRLEHDADGWLALTDADPFGARHVVLATGYAHSPVRTTWPGEEGFAGRFVHATEYRNADGYGGSRVLVVGAGNSGAEIAADLAEHGARVHLAIRTPPNVIPRQFGPVPATLLAVPMDYLPARLVDPVNRLLQRIALGDLTRYRMPAPRAGVVAQVRATGVTPTIDVGLVAALRAGRVAPVAALERFEGGDAVLSDGARLRPDVVVVASGYTTGLSPLVGHLGVLDAHGVPLVAGARALPSAPGLRFVGLFNPLKGQLLQIGLDARSAARAIARELRG